jgi:decaprenylphospho-beta-D-erythro-pentofuranosid-2-ulose 2-reductase
VSGSVLILAARSDIGLAIAHGFAKAGRPVRLAARNVASLDADRTDIGLRYGVAVTLHEFDALATDSHAAFVDGLPDLPEIAVCAVGLLGSQADSERDSSEAIRVMRTNYEGPANILAELANRFEARGSGILIGISSVAGERGRASNYVYGSAKAGLTAFLSGLRNRLSGTGVRVITVLPGFVATRMTEGLNLPPRLTAQPEDVAKAVVRAAERGRDVVYVPAVWRLIMFVIRALPEPVFKKTRL